MRRFAWQWLAINSLLVAALAARAEMRPQYGGTLHVSVREAPVSLDPADEAEADSFARRTLIRLIFDTLITMDESGRPVGALAESWQASRGNQRVQLRLRRGVKFHDGVPVSAEIVAAALRRANPTWNVRAENESVVIERDTADPDLIEGLALPRNAIARRDSQNRLSGTGPFHIADWQAGKKLVLGANEDYWRGRAFLDGIEIEMGRTLREQLADLEIGRTDIIEAPAEQIGRIPHDRYRVLRSAPVELVALLFTHEASSENERNAREALRWSVERGSMHNVFLRGAGEESASLLPTWISGYGFVFPREADLTKARLLRNQVRVLPSWSLAYDTRDPLAALIAERVALNAKDAGVAVRPNPQAAPADLRLVRIPLDSSNPWLAMTGVLTAAGLAQPAAKGHSLDDLYAAEQGILGSERIITLFHLPATYASAPNCTGWVVRPEGSLDVANAWLKRAQP
jgi:peptide/nickel transport system substrate-binding protein